MERITESQSWKALAKLAEGFGDVHLKDLVIPDGSRFERYSIEHAGVLFDYSRNLVTDQVHQLLVQLATDAGLPWWRDRLFDGEPINYSEDRAAGHPALRVPAGESFLIQGQDVAPAVHRELERLEGFAAALHDGSWCGATGEAITDVVNIGIGGSHLGPALACEALPRIGEIRVHFLSSIDPAQTESMLAELEPARTLFIVASKSFRTEETLANAETAKAWTRSALGEDATERHLVAVSADLERTSAFGIDESNVFTVWDWVGGRYSLWSAVGLPVIIHAGMDAFRDLLAGAREMDQHFMQAPLAENMPVMLAMVGVWYRNFLECQTHAVLPYMHRLQRFPRFLQQLEMESLGKSVDRDGEPVDYMTGGVVWGGMGNEGQHAFYQLLHQGTLMVPVDIIVPVETGAGACGSEYALQAHALAQGAALMMGRDEDAVVAEFEAQGVNREDMARLFANKLFAGSRPSNTLVIDELTPGTLGSLIALYEHKVFTQSVIWNINPFDQWGVELGKELAVSLQPKLASGEPGEDDDVSTRSLLEHIVRRRR